MTYSVKVRAKDANRAIVEIDDKKILDKTRKITEEKGFVFIPITDTERCDISIEHTFSRKKLKPKPKKKRFKDVVTKFLDDDEIEKLKTSFDIVGDLAIIEIDEELREKERQIAESLLETNKTVKGVFRKESAHEGRFRTQKMKHLAGENRLETTHKENNIRLKLDIEKVYFSVRQSTERKRVSSKVKDGERVLVLFSGCAPFPCVIAKNSNPTFVCGVEINPIGHEYGKENVRLNRLENVYLSNNDVKDYDKVDDDFKKIEGYDRSFDRIVMPHPSDSENFLEIALRFATEGTEFNFYTFSDEDKIEEKKDEMKNICEKNGFGIQLHEHVLCGQHSPGHYRICIDFRITKKG
ncbi:MAG: class I SAM-dependent methyltransferase [Candidatus Woesearchaeota archaeon]